MSGCRWDMADMSENRTNAERAAGVVLGFLEEAEHWQLASTQFPSKVGGKPAWLSQLNLPTGEELVCEKCQLPTVFLLQVYAPIVGQDRSFHRTLYVFCCRTPECYTANDNRSFKVYRSQLPRKNDFYSYDPPPDDEPATNADECKLESGVKLCRLCGCAGHKACSRCHAVTYCSKEHQTIDWKRRHKKECSSEFSSSCDAESLFLFPEWELVTEPEELPLKDNKPPDTNILEQSNIVFSDLEETELESMALHESQDSKVFQKFKERIAAEPHQVLRYFREGSPLWVSSEHIPGENDIPECPCGANRIFEFQIMPQLLNHLMVDRPDASIDWGTLAIYTCAASCDSKNYSAEFIWKQDISKDHAV